MKNFAFLVLSFIMYFITIAAPATAIVIMLSKRAEFEDNAGFLVFAIPFTAFSAIATIIAYFDAITAIDNWQMERKKNAKSEDT